MKIKLLHIVTTIGLCVPVSPFLVVLGTRCENDTAQRILVDSLKPIENITIKIEKLPEIKVSLTGNDPELVVARGLDINNKPHKGEISDGKTTVPILITKGSGVIFASCNRNTEDTDGGMLPFMNANFHTRDLVVHLGDQIYADDIAHNNTTLDESDLYQLFRQKYHKTWNSPDMSLLLRTSQNFMIGDDHDVISNIDHWMTVKNYRPKLISAGLKAYFLYQVQLHKDLHFPLDTETPVYFSKRIHSSTLLVVLDGRFERLRETSTVRTFFGPRQISFLKRRLEEHIDNGFEHIVFATQIPLLFIGRKMSEIADVWERERYPGLEVFEQEINEVLSILFSHASAKKFRVSFVGGDHHLYAEGDICSKYDPIVCFPQYVTSGLTKGSTTGTSFHLTVFTILNAIVFPQPETASYAYTPRSQSYHLTRNFLFFNESGFFPVLDKGCEWGRFCPEKLTSVYQVLFDNFYGIVMSVVLLLPGAAGLILLGLK
eukprot:TRINITY_DN2985_c1_g3_i1.p1 TRINITY_DN2985_c1_g3~~TRINITY_DN2985_c1_g3_i1.p1  ORF type:complete len:504 (+),score=27.31 TRINITY_DN2985_c1_g3_i1:50-1513(+)